jgi:cold shock CspA family protein
MGRSQETSNKKEVRSKQEKKRKEKEKKRISRKENERSGNSDDMIAYVDEYGRITSTPPDMEARNATKLEDIEISIPKRDSSQKSNPIRKGIVTYYNDSKGFGFIRDLETQESVFAHVNNFIDDIRQDNLVTFEIENGQRGPAAVRVKLFKKEAPEPTTEKS